MSGVETMIAGGLLGNRNNNVLLQAIERLETAINRQISFTPIPRNFLKSNGNNLSSNNADGVIILQSAPVPVHHRAVITDFNINFTTAAGTVRIAILGQDGKVRIDIIRDITASTNGTGEIVLDEGERVAIVGQVAGAGTFGTYVSGKLQRIRE